MAYYVLLFTSIPPIFLFLLFLGKAELYDEKLHITVLNTFSPEATPLGPPNTT
jgi:hypothetical protein